MVLFDNNFLLIALRPNVAASVDRAKERIDHLIEQLHRQGERIIVPTPVLAEVLVHAGKSGAAHLELLQKSSKFKIVPFDSRAAVEVALDIAASIKRGDKRGGAKVTWAKAQFDRQIAAIGKVEGAHTIYSDDADLAKVAKRLGMKTVALSDIQPPPSKHPLFDGIQEQDQPVAAEQAEDSASNRQSEMKSKKSTGEQPHSERQKAAKKPDTPNTRDTEDSSDPGY